jgi:hypothetical protein
MATAPEHVADASYFRRILMRSSILSPRLLAWTFLALVSGLFPDSRTSVAQQLPSAPVALVEKPETVEWVYRIRYGYHDEWFRIFRKYQLEILEKQKQLGYVKDYFVWAPGLHTSEDSRWDYRVVITRASHNAPPGESEGELARQLFPDQEAFHREENRRWELTTNHWDLPIHIIDINATE